MRGHAGNRLRRRPRLRPVRGPSGPGHAPAPEAEETFKADYHAVATGCVKVKQPAAGTIGAIAPLIGQIDALEDGELTPEERQEVDKLTGQVLGHVQEALLDPCDPATEEGCETALVPPDPRRCFLAKDEPSEEAPGSPCQTGGFIQQHFLTTGMPVGHGFAPAPALPPEKEGDFCEVELT